MRAFAHVMAEEFVGDWFTWFNTRPHMTTCGATKEEAVERLFALYGTDEFDVTGMIQLEERSSTGHQQLLVPHRHRVLIPSLSKN